MKFNKIFNEKRIFFLCLVLCIIILLLPHTIRYFENNDTIIGKMSYYHLRLSRDILQNKKIPINDRLSFNGRTYIFDPYHLVLASFGYIIGIKSSSLFLPFLLGIFSFILSYLLLGKLHVSIKKRLFILLILLLSPIFIYTYTVLNSYSFAIFLLLLGFYLFIQKNKGLSLISLLIFFFASLFGLENIFIAIIFMLTYSLFHKEKLRTFYIISIILVLFSSYYFGMFYYKNGFDIPHRNDISHIIRQFLSDLGSFTGFSIFTILLALIGLVILWKNKIKLIFVYMLLLILFILSFYSVYYNLYLNFVISIFAGIGFVALVNMKWSLKSIKNLTILVLLCGLFFTATSYILRLSIADPNPATSEALIWLKEHSSENEIVFSHYSRGFWIEYFAERPVFTDELFSYATDLDKRLNISDSIFYSRNLRDTDRLLKTFNISYIFIDEEMRDGLVWKKEKQGLLFLLRNNETFKNVYTNSGIEIWQYLVK